MRINQTNETLYVMLQTKTLASNLSLWIFNIFKISECEKDGTFYKTVIQKRKNTCNLQSWP